MEIADCFKLKVFGDYNLNVAQVMKFAFDSDRKQCGKMRKCCLPKLLHFSCIFKTSSVRTWKPGIAYQRVESKLSEISKTPLPM